MSWMRKVMQVAMLLFFGMGTARPAPLLEQDSPKVRGSSNEGLDRSGDALDITLQRVGLRRSDVGFFPRGWWARYPRAMRHKLDFVDDLRREPLAAVPFTRTAAQAVRKFLDQNALAVPLTRDKPDSWRNDPLFRLFHSLVDIRYDGLLLYPTRLQPKDTVLDDAILELYRYAGQPTSYVTADAKLPHPNIEAEIRRAAASLSPEVSRIVGRLVFEVVDAHRWVSLAFRNVPTEQRLAIRRRLGDIGGLAVTEGLEYASVHVFDDVAKSWDEASLWQGALRCILAMNEARLALQALPPQKLKSPHFNWETPLGWIRIRATGNDVIDATDGLLIVDLGGDDMWRGPVGSTSPTRLIGLALDLAGTEVYEGGALTQGAGMVGVGILFDAAGDDRYEAQSNAQGVGQFGFGALVDLGGSDLYRATHSAQGSAPFSGIGLLADAAGDDRYEVMADGQGFAGPGSVGLLADRAGNDVYHAEPDAQKSGRPNFGADVRISASSAQGVGVGRNYGHALAHSWAGGLGALVDIEGKDTYIAGGWAQGAGYWFGTGILYDGQGSDHYEARSFCAQACGSHYAIGVHLDEGGDDVQLAHGSGLGFGHDASIGLHVAIGGNDKYTSRGLAFGYSQNRAIAMFIDVEGDDVYQGREGDRPGSARYDSEFSLDADAVGVVNSQKAVIIPSFAYMTSIGLFLDVGGRDMYWGDILDGAVWGERPGSDNWEVFNYGVGMDVQNGTIDWRPLSIRR